jgi:hypothetical protein
MKSLYFSLIFLGNSLMAQVVDIQKDPTIDWAAIVDVLLPADPVYATADEDEHSKMAILKLVAPPPEIGSFVDHSLSSKLWEVAKSGAWEMYSDPEMTQRLTFEGYMSSVLQPDTSITFDPETYEEKITIGCTDRMFPYEASLIKVRQILTYSNAKADFGVQTLAIAPCYDNGEPIYWLRLPNVTPSIPQDYAKDPNITWAMRYTTLDSSPGSETWIELKNTTGPMPERFLDRVRTDTMVELLNLDGEPIFAAQRPCLFSCTDSLVLFDPQTWQELVQIKEVGLDFEQVTEIQLIEDWFWHEAEGVLTLRLHAIAPQYWTMDKMENKYRARRFYRKCKGG